jgi:hypothetical protein
MRRRLHSKVSFASESGVISMQSAPNPNDHMADEPAMNRHQVVEARSIAQQQMEEAITSFARQLPDGTRYVQEAINAAGALLDRLLQHVGLYDDAAMQRSATGSNPDLAPHRADVAGAVESEEIHDVTSGA